MRKVTILIFCISLLTISGTSYPQLGVSLDHMQNPPGLKWKKISTSHFNIVFPVEIVKDAQHVANMLEHIYPADGYSLKTAPRKISLVLHNQNTEANGFVGLAPRRSEWFNTPPQFGLIGVNPWYHLLAIHEFRHVVQFDRTRCGMTKWLYYFLGDYGHLAGAFFSLPGWVWEGDAVVMETVLTTGGRGRMPEFTMPIRTMLLSDKRYSYYKMIFGSYVNWMANPYPFGYLMISHLRRKQGAFIWSDVIGSTMALSLLPYRFSWSMHRKTGHAIGATYNATMDELKTVWQEQLKDVNLTEAKQINRDNRFLTNYMFPNSLEDGSIVTLKYGLADRYSFTRLYADGSEKTLFLPGTIFLDPPAVKAGKIVWNERLPHPRWGYLDYSAIKVYDLKSHTSRRLVKQSKWMAPMLSHDGRWIVTVEFSSQNKCQLVIVDAETGQENKRLPNPENSFLMTPNWSPDNRQIVFNSVNEQGRSLSIIDVETGQWQHLLDYSNKNTSLPIYYNDYVLFNWDYSGIDNIYAIHLQSKEIRQVTARKFGAFNPAVSTDGRELYFNDYTLQGYQAAKMVLDPGQWKKLAEVPCRPFRYHEPIVQQEAGEDLLKSTPNIQYSVQDYHALKEPINIHSWMIPIIEDADNNVTAEIYSQNLLGTLGVGVGYTNNQNEETNSYSATLSYAGWFPIIDFSGRFGERTSSYTDQNKEQKYYSWREKGLALGVRLPLNLTRNVYQTRLELGATAELTDISQKNILHRYDQNNGLFTPVSYYIQFFRGYQWLNEMYPHFGQSLFLLFRHVPLKSDYHGQLSSAQLDLFFPGLARHHGLRLQLAMEKQNPQPYRFENEIRFCRGYSFQFHDRFYRWSVDYGIPLVYPDWNGLGLIYLKKIQSDLFYDDVEARDGGFKSRYRSTGLELMFHVYLLSIPAELPMGVRFAYLVKEKKWQTEFLFSIGL